jgi:ubiquinone/menaquinone biosynthesis C-methylase UbiE
LLAGLAGRVVEVGAGNGLNFSHYPASVNEVVAVEPEPYLRVRAEARAAAVAVPVRVVDGAAAHLPLANASVDAGVASLVLCSVADPAGALAELHRVIRPGGELRFYEHVLSTIPTRARRQRRADPIWTRVIGGCHLTRDTQRAMVDAGFVIEGTDRFEFAPCFLSKLSAEHILGCARRP